MLFPVERPFNLCYGALEHDSFVAYLARYGYVVQPAGYVLQPIGYTARVMRFTPNCVMTSPVYGGGKELQGLCWERRVRSMPDSTLRVFDLGNCSLASKLKTPRLNLYNQLSYANDLHKIIANQLTVWRDSGRNGKQYKFGRLYSPTDLTSTLLIRTHDRDSLSQPLPESLAPYFDQVVSKELPTTVFMDMCEEQGYLDLLQKKADECSTSSSSSNSQS